MLVHHILKTLSKHFPVLGKLNTVDISSRYFFSKTYFQNKIKIIGYYYISHILKSTIHNKIYIFSVRNKLKNAK